eukprot:superscaffoldBa00003755_g17621
MDNWSRPSRINYKRWRNAELRGEVNFVGNSDEDQGTDAEICTIATARVDSRGKESASTSGSNKTEETFTLDEALEAVGFGKFQWKISLLTGLSWIGDAMEMMILSILGPQLHCEWRLPSYKVALITSVVFVGTGISSPVWGNVSDKYGRKIGLTFCMCWTLYYGLLSAFAPVYGWLLVLRGLAFWAIGAVFEVLLALLVMPTLGWRWLLGLSTIPMAIFVCFCFWLPESPRFDVLAGKKENAMATLTRIAKENGKALPPGKVTVYKQGYRGRIKDLFTPQYRSTTLLLWFIWITLAILIFIARAFISGGFQVAFVYTPEVYPTETRALGMGTSSAMARLGSLITPFVAQVMLRTSVYLTLSVYCGCSLLAGIASLILPIETNEIAGSTDSVQTEGISPDFPLMRTPVTAEDARSRTEREQRLDSGVSPPTMALVTLQRSPTPSAASSASTTNSSAGEDFGSDDDRKINQSLSESFFMVKGAALFLQQGGNAEGPKTPTHHKHAGKFTQLGLT